MNQHDEGNNAQIVWLPQPISDGFYLLSILDFQEGNHNKALENMRRAIFWNPVRSAFFAERGYMLLNKQDGADILMAQVAYNRALELADNPEDFAAALRGLGFVMSERNRIETAIACLVLSAEYDPTSMDTEQMLASLSRVNPRLFATIDVEKAKEILQENSILHTYSPKHSTVLVSMAEAMLKNETPQAEESAKRLLERAVQMNPNNPMAALRLRRLNR